MERINIVPSYFRFSLSVVTKHDCCASTVNFSFYPTHGQHLCGIFGLVDDVAQGFIYFIVPVLSFPFPRRLDHGEARLMQVQQNRRACIRRDSTTPSMNSSHAHSFNMLMSLVAIPGSTLAWH
jgi:hypothetical protein